MKRIYLTTALALLSSAAYAESNINELRSHASAPTFSHSAVNPSQPVAGVIAGCFKQAFARTTVLMVTTAGNVPA